MSFLLIMNPGSRAGRGQRLWGHWRQGLDAAGAEYECVCTEGLGHARELARTVAGHDTVVAVGGDGTINEVLDGVVQSGDSALRMGVLYSGTSPDFCRFHRIPLAPTEAVAALLSGRCWQVDVARVAFRDAAGSEQMAHFGCSCNIGLGARIARQANHWRPKLGDTLGTGLAMLTALLGNHRVTLNLEVDGEPLSLPATTNLSVVKNPHIASGLKLKLDVRPDDGRMWLVGLSEHSRCQLLRLIPAFYSGQVTAAPGLLLRACQTVNITAAQVQEIEFDGDPRGYLPARITLLPHALNLVGGSYD